MRHLPLLDTQNIQTTNQILGLRLHFNSPRFFLLSVGQTKKITFHHFRFRQGGESTDYGLYITDRAESSASQTEIF